MEKKVTKREVLEQIKTRLTDEVELEVVQSLIDQIDKRAEKARERAAAKKVAGDDLRERIHDVLGDTPRTIPEILAALDEEDLTPSKITPRLTQLIKLGCVGKEKVKTEAGEKMAYFTIEA